MVNSKDFAERLQQIIDHYGLTASGFADAIDFNRSSISHLLSGRNKPSLEFVMKVLEEFPEVKLYWLLNGKGNFPDPDLSVSSGKRDVPLKTSPSLFEDDQKEPEKDAKADQATHLPIPANKKVGPIERIVIFFKDGTFKTYQNE